MKRFYQRSNIINYYELTSEQQAIATDLYNECTDDSFVLWNNEPLSLSNFLRINSKFYHGQYTLTAFSCYFIRISKDNSQATVIYAYC